MFVMLGKVSFGLVLSFERKCKKLVSKFPELIRSESLSY